MVDHIWNRLKKPIIALAPMAGVTDSPFRRTIVRNGRPDLMFTEFVSCAGLCSEGRPRLLPELNYHKSERPLIAQIFGSDPDDFCVTAELIAELGFDGIDLNMGCPDRSVQKQGAGARLIQDPTLMKKIVKAAKRGAGELPVSIKTRIGYSRNSMEVWLRHLLEAEPAAITLHWRTKKQMYKGEADWSLAPKAVEIARAVGSDALILGNGDVKTLAQAHELADKTGVDGVMIGRGVFANPWVFNPSVDPEKVTWREGVESMIYHMELFVESGDGARPFLALRRHIKSYINGFRGAKELRIELQKANKPDDMRVIVDAFAAGQED